MEFVVLDDETVIWGKSYYNRSSIRFMLETDFPFVDRSSFNIPEDPPSEPFTVYENIKIYPAIHEHANYDIVTQYEEGPYWEVRNDTAVGVFIAKDKDINTLKSELLSKISKQRYDKEQKGFSYTHNGVNYWLDTSREGRNLFSTHLPGTWKLKTTNSQTSVDIVGETKTVEFASDFGSFLEMTQEDLETFDLAIKNYIQSLFDEENTLSQQVNSCTTLQELKELGI